MKITPKINSAICPSLGLVQRDSMRTLFELGPVTIKPLKMFEFKSPYIKFRYGKDKRNDPSVQ